MRRVYNRAGRALIPEPRSPEKRIKRLVRENGRTTKFVIAFESVDAPLRNDSVLTLSVCNRVKCRSCLLAGRGGGPPSKQSLGLFSSWRALRALSAEFMYMPRRPTPHRPLRMTVPKLGAMPPP